MQTSINYLALIAYDSETELNKVNVSSNSGGGGTISLPDYNLIYVGYQSGYKIRVTAKRDGVLHLGSETVSMTNGQSYDKLYQSRPQYDYVNGYFE